MFCFLTFDFLYAISYSFALALLSSDLFPDCLCPPSLAGSTPTHPLGLMPAHVAPSLPTPAVPPTTIPSPPTCRSPTLPNKSSGASPSLTGSAHWPLVAQVGPHICVFKTHVDVFDSWSPDVAKKLRELADKHGACRGPAALVGQGGGKAGQAVAGGHGVPTYPVPLAAMSRSGAPASLCCPPTPPHCTSPTCHPPVPTTSTPHPTHLLPPPVHTLSTYPAPLCRRFHDF